MDKYHLNLNISLPTHSPFAETESQVEVNISQLTFLAASHSSDDGTVDNFGVKTAVSSALRGYCEEENRIEGDLSLWDCTCT